MKKIRDLPLATLKTFAAAARLQSLSMAAKEVNLTESAISHQLRRLESTLGCKLFAKCGRGVVLTDAGRVFSKVVTQALEDIVIAAECLTDGEVVGGRLTIACPPQFASTWLASNIGSFCREHPTVETHIRLADNEKLSEFTEHDLGIRFGVGGWADCWSTLLTTASIAPACSPQLYQDIENTLSDADGLSNAMILHCDDGTEWRRWATEYGNPAVLARCGQIFCSDLEIAISLAVNGAGIALVSDTLAESHFRRGSLVRSSAFSIEAFGGWHVLSNAASLQRLPTRLFLRWLLSRFKRDEAWASLSRSA